MAKQGRMNMRITVGLRERIDVLAERLGLSRSELIRMTLEDLAEKADKWETVGMLQGMRETDQEIRENLFKGKF